MIQQKCRQLVILAAAAVCLFYLTYRLLFTLNLTTPYACFVSVFLYCGEFYGVFVLGLFFLQVWDSREPPQQPVLGGRTVDVFVPTYNEDPQLLRMTLEACSRLDYPHKTYLCDDGGTEARLADPEKGPAAQARAEVLKKMCAELRAIYMPRPDNRHAKAGNLNHAFEKTDGEFIIILDADHVPEPHFISRLIGYFKDEKLGFVQTPHAFYNFDSFQARLDHKNRRYWEEGHLFYEVIQPGRNRWNCPIFAGSAAMFRRKALEEVGYIAVETITEDMHTGMRVNAKGWKSLAVSERLVAGQSAPDVTTFHSQRIRWGEGNLSIMAYDNPLTMKGLTLAQRFCYLGSMVHWAGGLFKLAVYLTPILMMFTGVPPVAEFTWGLALITLVYLVASVYGVRVASNGFGSFFNGELFCMVNFWTQIRGTMRALFWRKFQQFVVTAKRGRQAKTIWPYVRPQVALIGLSVLALFWGWYRVAAGVSDDYFKPIIPTFWILFHVALAFLVLRRALWPEDQRFSSRHFVHLPTGYECRGVDADGNALGEGGRARGLGLTVDLNEMGVGLVAYEPLPVHALVRLTLHGRGEAVECEGEIRWAKDLTARAGKGAGMAGGYRCGVAFRDLSPERMDAVNRMTLHYAVPRLYSEYAQGRQRTLWRRIGSWLAQGLIHRRTALRRQARLPLVLDPDRPRGPAAVAVTEDVSRTAMSALLTTPLAPGTELDFFLPTPLGEVRGRAKVLRGEPRRYAARDYQLCVFEFVSFAGQGRVTLEMALNPRRRPDLGPVLNPDRELLPVPMARPVGVGLLAAVPMLVVALGCFHFLHRDDFFLRDLALARRPITEDEIDRLEGIFAATVRQNYPSTDRLVLLMGAMGRVNRPHEADQITMLLAPRDRRNLDLQFALAQILDNTKDYPKAEEEYQRLLKKLEDGGLPASRKRELLLAAARASVHAGNLERAGERFRELLRTYPDNHAIRNEFAGVLMGARQFPEAARLYRGVEPDLNGRLLLVAIHAQSKDFEAAEKECRTIVRLRPKDPQAKLLLADVLSWKKGGVRQSRAIYEQLLKVNAGNPDLLIRLAQVALWGKNYREALDRFQALIEGRLDNPEIVKGYVDAAASADPVGPAQHRTALAIYERALTGSADDPVFLTRLAWVLQRFKEMDKSAVLLDRVVALNPKDPALRKEVFGTMLATGHFAERLKEFEGKELDFDTRQILVNTYLKNGNLGAAAAECRRLVKLRPGDRNTLRQLADILSWNKEYPEALAVLGQLARTAPDDPELQVRRAEVTLWSGDHDQALAHYQVLLEAKFDQPKLWPGYAAAAASAKNLTDSHRRLVLRIYEGTAVEDLQDAVFLARLAWVLQRLKETDRARVLLDRAVAVRPPGPAARKELAGVLAAAGRSREALGLYEGLPLDLADRYRLAALHAAVKDFAAAADQCRAILREKPQDRKARRQLADVLSWNKDYPEALALLEQLARDDPGDPELPVRLAEVTLWSGAYDKALTRFQALLEAKFDQPELWRSFVDAAAGAPQLTDAHAGLAVRIYERTDAEEAKDVVFLARLAWVLQRVKETAKASALLDRAVVLRPPGPAARKELAGVLAAAGRSREALRLYEGLPLELADRYRLAALHAAVKDFAAAAEQCRAILKEKPTDKRARRQLADILSWKKDYPEALALMQKLAEADPTDAELPLRIAQLTLWSGDYAKALARLQALLEANFNQPELWRSFVDAAASARQLTDAQVGLAVRIAEQAAVKETKDAAFLARLAWLLYRAKEPAKAGSLLDRAMALKPKDTGVRRELAGTLAAVGKFTDALQMYEGVKLDLDDRYHLVGIYATALLRSREVLEDKPDDKEARRQSAYVLTWKKVVGESVARFEDLARAAPADHRLQVRRAEVTLWSGDHDKALAYVQALLEEQFDQPPLRRSYLDAAASASLPLTEAHKRMAVRIYGRHAARETKVEYLSRLAWVLYRVKELAKVNQLLDRAVALRPAEPAVRKELAGVLAAAGRHQQARQMYQGLKLTPADRYRLAEIDTAGRKFDAAEKQVRAILEERPGDLKAQMLLATIYSGSKQFAKAAKLYQQLLEDNPQDPTIPVKLAELALWGGDYDTALAQFQKLLDRNAQQPALWKGYIDAAASAKALPETLHRTVLRIYQNLREPEAKDAVFLTRLAWVLRRVKEPNKSIALLKKDLALDPGSRPVRLQLAQTLHEVGAYREPGEHFKVLLRK
jgi:cellulose synthase/poly-beta-1,6-N-acetylglucosamine synthase-like glycosyltransferase/tetratricopeptide (TPR) repeat protein